MKKQTFTLLINKYDIASINCHPEYKCGSFVYKERSEKEVVIESRSFWKMNKRQVEIHPAGYKLTPVYDRYIDSYINEQNYESKGFKRIEDSLYRKAQIIVTIKQLKREDYGHSNEFRIIFNSNEEMYNHFNNINLAGNNDFIKI